jgi:hypothetical protein
LQIRNGNTTGLTPPRTIPGADSGAECVSQFSFEGAVACHGEAWRRQKDGGPQRYLLRCQKEELKLLKETAVQR